jgi:hypothetical protein
MTTLLAVATLALLLHGGVADAQPAGRRAADASGIAVDDKSIGGILTSRFRPEAGVWVDWFNILGLGAKVPYETGNQSDSLHALVGGQIVELRVPYPMGFFAKGLEGRIDDPKAGWKGRALWASSGNRTPFHIEGVDAPAPGAPGMTPETRSSPLVVEFQLRPSPSQTDRGAADSGV